MEVKLSGNANTTLSGESTNRIDSTCLQSVNTEEPSTVKVFGKITFSKDVQSPNANLPMTVT